MLFRYFYILIKQITIINFYSPSLCFIRRLFVKLVAMVCSEDVEINTFSFTGCLSQIKQFKVVQNPLFKNFLIILNTYYAVVMWAIWFFSLQ